MSSKPKIVFLFDMTRHRSHLFFRFFGTHPDVQDLWHPFLPAFLFGPERITLRTTDDGEWINPSGTSTYAEGTKKFLDAVKDAEDRGKVLVANEHTQMVYKQDLTLNMIRNQSEEIEMPPNPTVIPDDIFATLTPIFVIRNPVFAVPSNYVIFSQYSKLSPGREDWKMVNGMRLQRRLFDHFLQRDKKPPLVIDGDDVVWRTDAIRTGLSHALNLGDPACLSSTWDAVPEDRRNENPILRHFLQTIDDSTGIQSSNESPPDPDLTRAHAKWVDAYGAGIADQLKATVERNVPHYEYMSQFKI